LDFMLTVTRFGKVVKASGCESRGQGFNSRRRKLFSHSCKPVEHTREAAVNRNADV